MVKTINLDTVQRQQKYVKDQRTKGRGLGLVFADAFLRGMRDLGYKSPAWALAEMVDNSYQAGAQTISIRFGFEASNKTEKKPDHVAVIDDGNGMIPEMISYAVRWGGTDREDDRQGFGRYGYGLPSAAVSMAKRYTVYSKVQGGGWHAVTVDIDALARAANDLEKTEQILSPREEELPEWVVQAETELDLTELASGTVVVLEDLDRLRRLDGWISVKSLKSKLLNDLGVIYRYWLPERRLLVDGTTTQSVDPLFLMEHARFYDENAVRAVQVETRTFEVETPRGTRGSVTIRASILPPDFQLQDPSQFGQKGAKTNTRYEIMKKYNGIVVCREERQIDTVQPTWTSFQNYDRSIRVEIDFDPELDEFFGITTSKQQITLDDDMWQRLRQDGQGCGNLFKLIGDLRKQRDRMDAELKALAERRQTEAEKRPSVTAMAESEQFKGVTPTPTPAQAEKAREDLEQEAVKRAEVQNRPKDEVLVELEEETRSNPWAVQFQAIPEGPFYRPHRLGEQKRVIINTEHPFYQKIYNVHPEARAALEVMLFVLAERELEVSGHAESFYKAERQKWSERLRYALDFLSPDDTLIDAASSVAERLDADVSLEGAE